MRLKKAFEQKLDKLGLYVRTTMQGGFDYDDKRYFVCFIGGMNIYKSFRTQSELNEWLTEVDETKGIILN